MAAAASPDCSPRVATTWSGGTAVDGELAGAICAAGDTVAGDTVGAWIMSAFSAFSISE